MLTMTQTQDLYPTMLRNQLEFSPDAVTITMCILNLGGFCGGLTVGWLSNVFGRRFTLLVTFVMAGALLYPYGFVSTRAVAAAAFFEQFFIQGAMGVVPIHMMELSPGTLRTFAVGTAYQLGNLISSASVTIEAKLGENYPLPPTASGTKRYHYGKVMCIFTAACIVYNIIITFIGPENRGADFSAANQGGVVTEKAETAIDANAPSFVRQGEDDVDKTHPR
jgi:MFS transporter, SHS family, lactate transporter